MSQWHFPTVSCLIVCMGSVKGLRVEQMVGCVVFSLRSHLVPFVFVYAVMDVWMWQMQELQEELNNVSRDKQKVAVKKVVAGMMVGKDVSSLFMSMLKCMQTTDLELKKLVYLYLINCKPISWRPQPLISVGVYVLGCVCTRVCGRGLSGTSTASSVLPLPLWLC